MAWTRGRREEAIARGEETLRAIEAIRSGQATSASQAGLFSTWSDDFYWFSGTLLDASQGNDPALLDRAFGVAERLRARTLLDALVTAQVAPLPREELEERLHALEDALMRVNSRRSDPGLPAIERDHAREDAAALTREKSQVNDQIKRLPAHRLEQDLFATPALVRQWLRPNEALLSFQVAPWHDWTGDFGGGTWLVVVTHDAAPRAYRLNEMGRPELRREVDRFADLLEPGDGGRRTDDRRNREVQQLAADLGSKLLAAALADLPATVDRLIVVPDDVLHRLPFGALRPASGAPVLARRYTISLAPSATLWVRGRKDRRPALRAALALANPRPPDAAALEKFRAAGINVPEEPLPYAESEAESAVGSLGGEERAGRNVSRSYFLEADLTHFGLLHFAAHSLVDVQDPDSSGIWLSPGRGAKGGDGLLRMTDIARLPLDRRIVVLSACSTARGKLVRGEGVLSLARAFFEAKASAVIASLWPQRDDDAAKLFDRFYRHISEGESLAAAFAEAQRDRMNEGAPTAAWAGFVVLGDGDLVPLPGGRSWLAINRRPLALAAGLAALLALAGAALHRRSRRSGVPYG
ncbi:MAG TPA: CHAT domain-containing protein [Thermoanaerobaculia bacterium]